MGEMFAYLQASDLAFVGGSLVPVGGHNVLEPAAIGRPVLFGPQMFNFTDAARLLLEAGAAVQIGDAESLAARVGALFDDAALRSSMGAAGAAAVRANQGALQRILAHLHERPRQEPA